MLEELRPYVSNKAAAEGSCMRVTLPLFSLSISPQFGRDFRGTWKLLAACSFDVGWYREARVWC